MTAIPVLPSKAETWGLPIGLAVIGVIGSIVGSVLSNRGRIKKLEGRLSELESQPWQASGVRSPVTT